MEQNFFQKTNSVLVEAKNFFFADLNANKYDAMNVCGIFDIDQTLFHLDESPNEQVINFFKFLSDVIGLTMYIVTARIDNGENMKRTVELLQKHDIRYNRIYFRSITDGNDIQSYKHKVRQFITQTFKKEILISVGDMCWDINTLSKISVLVPIPVTYSFDLSSMPSYTFQPCIPFNNYHNHNYRYQPFQYQPFQYQPFQYQPLQHQPLQHQPLQHQPLQHQPLQHQPFQHYHDPIQKQSKQQEANRNESKMSD